MEKLYDIEFLYAGPLFIHQLSHVWIDFRGIQDEYMLSKGIDYFENSRRATYVQQKYATHNPKKFPVITSIAGELRQATVRVRKR